METDQVQAAEEAIFYGKQFEENYILTDEELDDIVEKVFQFCLMSTGIHLFPYQQEFGRRIIRSLIFNDGEEITALFARQSGKCLAKNTPVLMYDGNIKAVQDIVAGDLLMGDDSQPRTVLSTARGTEEMFEVRPRNKYHESYTVNRSHIMTVWNHRKCILEDKPLEELLKMKPDQQSYRGAKVPVSYIHQDLPVEPYFLGLWLGDGARHGVRVTTADSEIVEYLSQYAQRLGMKLSEYEERGNCSSYAITHGENGGAKTNPLRSALTDWSLQGKVEKYIPQEALVNDRETRLSVLAGLIDADGHRPEISGKCNTCEIVFKDARLANDTVRLSRSLGFRASSREKVVEGQVYYRVMLYGELWHVPTKIERKKYPQSILRENPLTYGFDLVSKGVGEYFGFEIDGNKRYLLGDHTVTHNTETVAVIIDGCMVILPLLAQMDGLKEDSRIAKYADGLHVGIFAPTYEQAAIMHSRMATRMSSPKMRATLSDPEIDMAPGPGRRILHLNNGSFCDCNTAAPGTSIEGKTYHVILTEETQGISNFKLRKSIHPMGAATNATMVKIGTPNPMRNDFHDACERGRAKDLEIKDKRFKTHFHFDYTYPSEFNPNYRKYIQKEIERLGFDSDEFRMAYRLHWLFERSQFVAPEEFDELGIRKRDHLRKRLQDGTYSTFIRTSYPTTNDPTTENLVASIDIGRTNDSTVVTIMKVWWDNPIVFGGGLRYHTHIVNWLEMVGDDHELQYPQILSFLDNYNIGKAIIDSTGKGEPIYDRLYYDLHTLEDEHNRIDVVPFVFSMQSKHRGYKLLEEEIKHGRATYPSGDGARKMTKQRKFVQQTTDLVKNWRGKYMNVEAPTERGNKMARSVTKTNHDDYPDSWMMAVWAVNGAPNNVVQAESGDNPLMVQRHRSKVKRANEYFGSRSRSNRQKRRRHSSRRR